MKRDCTATLQAVMNGGMLECPDSLGEKLKNPRKGGFSKLALLLDLRTQLAEISTVENAGCLVDQGLLVCLKGMEVCILLQQRRDRKTVVRAHQTLEIEQPPYGWLWSASQYVASDLTDT